MTGNVTFRSGKLPVGAPEGSGGPLWASEEREAKPASTAAEPGRRRLWTQMVLRLDLAWHRRPRLSEAVLAVVGIPALCLFTAGAAFYVARTDGMPGLAWLLVCTLPLKVLALTIGTHRRRLRAVLDVRRSPACGPS